MEEARDFAEAEAQCLLGIGMDEVIRRYDAGEYNEVYDALGYWHIGHLEMLIDVVR